MNKTLIVIQGPTAVGKTAIAVELAKVLKTEIINADSRQVFEEMKIGTARPDETELKGVKHHLLAHKSIEEDYSAEIFAQEARTILNQLFKDNPVVIVSGGSGFYIQALLQNLDVIPDVPKEIRNQINEEIKNTGISDLLKELKTSDPKYYESVDQSNKQRIVRALEVIRHTGKAFSSFHSHEKKTLPFKTLNFALTRERENLYSRINKRVDEMIKNGLENEARLLLDKKHLNALQTVGYSEIFDYFDSKLSKEESVELIKRNTRRFAKRQLTWLRRIPDLIWINLDQEVKAKELILKKLNGLA